MKKNKISDILPRLSSMIQKIIKKKKPKLE